MQVALLDDGDVAVVRVSGRGNFLNSVPLKQFAEGLARAGKPREFIVDLRHCETLDSTFMGVLASISLIQQRAGRGRLVLVNVCEHVNKLLSTLGLVNLLTVSSGTPNSSVLAEAESCLQSAPAADVSHAEQLAHTLEAHKTLVRLDTENELRFQSVIHYLEKSLQDAAKH